MRPFEVFIIISIVIIIAIVLAIVSFGVVFGPPSPGTVVKCTDYYQIVDKYKMPGPEYHIVYKVNFEAGFGYNSDSEISEEYYNKINIGQYVQFLGNNNPINLKQLPEGESGFRNACEVVT